MSRRGIVDVEIQLRDPKTGEWRVAVPPALFAKECGIKEESLRRYVASGTIEKPLRYFANYFWWRDYVDQYKESIRSAESPGRPHRLKD